MIVSHDDREAFPGLTVYTGTKFFWAGAVKSLRSADLSKLLSFNWAAVSSRAPPALQHCSTACSVLTELYHCCCTSEENSPLEFWSALQLPIQEAANCC